MTLRSVTKRWLAVVFMAVLALAVSGAALSAELAGDETYRLAAGEIVDDDLYVAAAEIYIGGIVKGDLIAVANNIELGPTGVVEGDFVALANNIDISPTAIVEGDLWAGAAGIEMHGTVLDDLRVAGRGIELSGIVADDAFLAAGGGPADIPAGMGPQSTASGLRVTGEIGGDAFVFAGGADISGAIGGDLRAGLGSLDLSGIVGGDAEIQVGEFSVSDSARIGGELKYTAAEELQFPAGVARDIQFEAPPEDQAAGGTIVGAIFGWIFRTVAIGIGVAILGWLLMRFRPNALIRPAAAIRAKPVETGVYGLLAAVLLVFIPVASIILVAFTWAFWGVFPAIATFVFLGASSALVWFLSPLLTGFWLGEIIGERLGGDRSPLLLLLTGALLIVFLGRIPFLGWLVYLLSFVLALGGLLRSGTSAATAHPEEEPVGQQI
jgi:hypothetical protein